jgi:hypothetical protein
MDFRDPEDWKALGFVVVLLSTILILISFTG